LEPTERLGGDIERRYERLSKRLGGPSVAPLMIYLGQLGYIGLYLGTLRLGCDLRWLLLEGIHNPKRKLWTSASQALPQLCVYTGGVAPAASHHALWLELVGGGEDCHLLESYMSNLPHIKVQEWMGYSWPCYKRSLSLTSSSFFCACLATGYVPATWTRSR
jgi:hypothetical protein